MTRPALAFALLTVLGCNGTIGHHAGPGAVLKSVPGDHELDNVQLTHYTLVTEDESSGQHSGDSSVLCNELGLSGCYHKEFLCSGWGVAMEGTGIASNGKYIKYVSGGGGWSSHYTWLNNCSSARFAETDASYGSTGRALIEEYSIAVDPSVIAYGSYVFIEAEGHWFRADDTGGAIIGRHIDIYEGANRSYGGASSSRVYVTTTHHDSGDASPWGGGPASTGGTGSTPTGGSGCGSLDFTGECQGPTLRWCENGSLNTADCAAQGLVCGYQDASVGYNCLTPSTGSATSCGDGTCDSGEDCTSCPSDCGACAAAAVCGDGTCDATEDCASCPSDCGACAAGSTCGDGWCDATEDCGSCPSDCGTCGGGSFCGDGTCDATEDCSSCPDDCGTCTGGSCGDGWCDATEDCSTCPSDCGTCGGGSFCGDGTCDASEDCSSCPDDCGACDAGSGGSCSVEGQMGLGENGDPCSEAPETWRCAYSDHWGTTASQVCRGGVWVTYDLNPSDCSACCGSYSSACHP